MQKIKEKHVVLYRMVVHFQRQDVDYLGFSFQEVLQPFPTIESACAEKLSGYLEFPLLPIDGHDLPMQKMPTRRGKCSYNLMNIAEKVLTLNASFQYE